jgi:hypothetical protein
MRSLNAEIEAFTNHFGRQLDRLKGYELDPEDRVLKKNVMASMIDAISRVTSNANDSHRDRFTSIVKHFGDWLEHDRVSAPHISYLLTQLRSPSFKDARSLIRNIVTNNSDGRLIQLSEDPTMTDVLAVWPVQAETKLVGRLSLTSFTHLNLLYSYRNSLVHEFREPGHGFEFSDEDELPFYHGRTMFEGDSLEGARSLELVYPLNFYYKLTENIIRNVKAYLMENRINPYDSYEFGSSWVGELNR